MVKVINKFEANLARIYTFLNYLLPGEIFIVTSLGIETKALLLWKTQLTQNDYVENQPTHSEGYSSLIGNNVMTMNCQGKIKVAWLIRHHIVILK